MIVLGVVVCLFLITGQGINVMYMYITCYCTCTVQCVTSLLKVLPNRYVHVLVHAHISVTYIYYIQYASQKSCHTIETKHSLNGTTLLNKTVE